MQNAFCISTVEIEIEFEVQIYTEVIYWLVVTQFIDRYLCTAFIIDKLFACHDGAKSSFTYAIACH